MAEVVMTDEHQEIDEGKRRGHPGCKIHGVR